MRLGVEAALVHGELVPGDVSVEDGRVVEVGLAGGSHGLIAIPGLVDIQNNGYGSPYAPYYPNDRSVDILGLDIYSSQDVPEFRQSYYTELCEVCVDKPVWIAETGDTPTPDLLRDQPLWTGFTEWAYMLTDRPFNAEAEYKHIIEMYQAAVTITRDRLPAFAP